MDAPQDLNTFMKSTQNFEQFEQFLIKEGLKPNLDFALAVQGLQGESASLSLPQPHLGRVIWTIYKRYFNTIRISEAVKLQVGSKIATRNYALSNIFDEAVEQVWEFLEQSVYQKFLSQQQSQNQGQNNQLHIHIARNTIVNNGENTGNNSNNTRISKNSSSLPPQVFLKSKQDNFPTNPDPNRDRVFTTEPKSLYNPRVQYSSSSSSSIISSSSSNSTFRNLVPALVTSLQKQIENPQKQMQINENKHRNESQSENPITNLLINQTEAVTNKITMELDAKREGKGKKIHETYRDRDRDRPYINKLDSLPVFISSTNKLSKPVCPFYHCSNDKNIIRTHTLESRPNSPTLQSTNSGAGFLTDSASSRQQQLIGTNNPQFWNNEILNVDSLPNFGSHNVRSVNFKREAETNPATFASRVIQSLLADQEMEDKLSGKKTQNRSRFVDPFSEQLAKAFRDKFGLKEDFPDDILDNHVSRVWSDAPSESSSSQGRRESSRRSKAAGNYSSSRARILKETGHGLPKSRNFPTASDVDIDIDSGISTITASTSNRTTSSGDYVPAKIDYGML